MCKKRVPDGTLLSTTRRLLKESGRTYEEVALGTGLSIYWVKKIHEFQDPGTNKVQRVYEFITGTTLLDDATSKHTA